MSETLVIRTHKLQKAYGRVQALAGFNLEVRAGEVHGLLGPNGAGKSTLIRVLMGLARADHGVATVLGRNPWRDTRQLHARIAYVPGDVTLWPSLTGGETIDVLAQLRGARVKSPEYQRERERLSRVFQFDSRVRGHAYSKGNRQKVALIQAFVHRADLYVFDEPTSGLDPLMEVAFREEVLRVTREGATVLLSSHILSEVEHLCDRVSIIRSGNIVDEGTLDELRHLTHTEVSCVAAPGDTAEKFAAGGARVSDFTVTGGRVRFTVPSDEVTELLPVLAQLRVRGLNIAPPTLESLFLHHYGGQETS